MPPVAGAARHGSTKTDSAGRAKFGAPNLADERTRDHDSGPALYMIVRGLVAGAVSVAVLWMVLIAVLFMIRPNGGLAREGMRVLPDTVRLVRRLATDRALGVGIRIRLWLLLAYLLSPIDLVPDFVPVIGFADDVIVLAFVLRSVIRRAGVTAVQEHWPGTPQGLQVLGRLCHLELGRPQ